MCDDDSIDASAGAFHSDVVDRMRMGSNVWRLPGGQLLLPEVFGFCRGVQRALGMLDRAIDRCQRENRNIFLLGEIIHNPWVNDHFRRRGVSVLTRLEIDNLEKHVTGVDCAVVPAFGVSLEVERRLKAIGCPIIDTSCGDVRRLWRWGEKAVANGFAILIFGRALHDETVVTKSRLAAAGGNYVVAGNLDEVSLLCEFLTGNRPGEAFVEAFGAELTNATDPQPFQRLAQVSQTTMLYNETMAAREILRAAFEKRFSSDSAGVSARLLFQPTVCRATQDRQSAAADLCSADCDLAVVVGGFGSSNTRHLYELAASRVPAVFIEGAQAIGLDGRIDSFDETATRRVVVRRHLPHRRPLRIAVLAGASCPEIVIGQVLQKLATFLE